MKTTYLVILFCAFAVMKAYATSDNPATKSVAMFFGALIFLGIIGILKLFKEKK